MFVVTGATGRTGRVVVEELLRAGRAVRAIGRSRQGLALLEATGAESFVAEPTDHAALTDAFTGAEGIYVMVQPNYIPDSPDFPAHQRAIVDAMTATLSSAGVRRVVTLSSWGADKPAGTGPVVGLHHLEQQTNTLDAVVTHLRAGYFMENLLSQVDTISRAGVVAAPFDADVAMPFIATADTGRAAAHHLLAPASSEILELQGERDLSMAEVTEIIGRIAELPQLRYKQQSIEEFATMQRRAGVSENVTDLMVEVAHAINSRHTATLQPRSPRTTTPTSIETFVTETLLPRLPKQSPPS
ncbi:NmrA family NAD(P)-binding protein [Nocardia brasiliensis]|uniref:NmrA family NAD(P)-binding protein n=1 Tax=Nocardia brasiliensis TaxID=37326 RepID=UPI0018953225|nr:NmrA family NAD(P)-binding protein [Nocardia brasiliensis]MBF6127082.1 NAD(P)H-binding protein [Nocardia brasiliensis]